MRDLVAGDRVDQYRLIELLARSGMASIFKAVDDTSGATVALKVPHLQFESDVSFFQRFTREEQIGQKLDHPNIVRILVPAKKSRLYLVMEYVEGKSLRTMVGDGRRMPLDVALRIARQICGALVYMHATGIVHRDLKPDNVLIDPAGQVKLLDFGISMDESARRLTWFGLTPPIGTPDYMAPEQIRGRRGDVRTDVYALGTMLYEMVTGDLPYTAANVHVMMRAKVNQDPRPPREAYAGIDPKIEEIISHAIERSPRERYPTAAELCADLADPERIVLGQRAANARRTPLLLRLHLPRGVVAPLVLLLVVGALLVLTMATGRSHDPHGTKWESRVPQATTAAAPAGPTAPAAATPP